MSDRAVRALALGALAYLFAWAILVTLGAARPWPVSLALGALVVLAALPRSGDKP